MWNSIVFECRRKAKIVKKTKLHIRTFAFEPYNFMQTLRPHKHGRESIVDFDSWYRNVVIAKISHSELNLRFGDKIWHCYISETVRVAENMWETFVQIRICHRRVYLWKLHSVTLTYVCHVRSDRVGKGRVTVFIHWLVSASLTYLWVRFILCEYAC